MNDSAYPSSDPSGPAAASDEPIQPVQVGILTEGKPTLAMVLVALVLVAVIMMRAPHRRPA